MTKNLTCSFHDTKHTELNILLFLGEVPEAYIDLGTEEFLSMDCDIRQVVVAQPAALEATPELIVSDKLPSSSGHKINEATRQGVQDPNPKFPKGQKTCLDLPVF